MKLAPSVGVFTKKELDILSRRTTILTRFFTFIYLNSRGKLIGSNKYTNDFQNRIISCYSSKKSNKYKAYKKNILLIWFHHHADELVYKLKSYFFIIFLTSDLTMVLLMEMIDL